jgi:hypothetical protein
VVGRRWMRSLVTQHPITANPSTSKPCAGVSTVCIFRSLVNCSRQVNERLTVLKQRAQSADLQEQGQAQYPLEDHLFEVKSTAPRGFAFLLEDNAFRIQLSRSTKLPAAYVKISSAYLAHVGPHKAAEALQALIEAMITPREGKHKQYCFTFNDKPIRWQISDKVWRRAVKEAGFTDLRFHDLRHTWASWHRQAGTSCDELKDLGGWKSRQMVDRYAKFATEHLTGSGGADRKPPRRDRRK